MEFAVPQKRLGPGLFLACVVIVCMLTQLPIDLYVPALPEMKAELGVSASVLNLTMFVFFFCSALGIVVGGPLMDRVGRRPIFVTACVLLMLGAFGCAMAPDVWVLIAFRVVQSVGFGFETTVATALIQDSFSGQDMQKAMTLMQSMMIIGPAIAPFAGSLLVVAFGWRGIFWTLGAIGVLQTALALLVSETLPEEHRTKGGIIQALGETAKNARPLLGNRSFVALAFVVGLAAIPYFAWIGTVSYDLLDFFGTTYLTYSVCYACTTIATIVAPYVFMFLSKRLSVNRILGVCFGFFLAATLLLGLVGTVSPLAFTLAFLPVTLGEGIIRPMGFVILLDQPAKQVGSASTVANFLYSMMMSVGTVLGTLNWSNYIIGVAVLSGASLVIMVVLYLWGIRSHNYVLPVDE